MSKKKSRKIGYRQVFMILFTLFWVIYPFIARVLVKKIPAPEDTFFANTRGLIIDLVQFCKEVALAVFTGGCILDFLAPDVWIQYRQAVLLCNERTDRRSSARRGSSS